MIPRNKLRLGSLLMPLLLLLLLSAVWTSPQLAAANPLPPGVMLVHVQPVDPDFCDQSTITTCPQVVQYTEALGVLEFDIFAFPLEYVWTTPEIAVYSLEVTVCWPPEWDFVDAQICGDGEGTIEQIGPNQATLSATWPACPLITSDDPLFLAGKFVMNVASDGEFHVYFNNGRMDCPPNDFEIGLLEGAARAGVQCSYCFTPCDLGEACRPNLSPNTLELEAVQGEMAEGEIDVLVAGGDLTYPCDFTADCTEGWMSVQVIWIDEEEYLIHVTADASSLDAGSYQGWVRGNSECVDCTLVNFTVQAIQGIPDGDDWSSADPKRPSAVSWGKLKAFYRK
ncbi:MAG: hypothetical protein KAY24_12850 [Candidatus Eisenbacteria sp.]|nr:hypothetical protein [Candidatus Eisenbacteria bacterium]